MAPLHLIDAFNFLHAVVLKGRDRKNWWCSENQARVVAAVLALRAGREPFDAWLVFDRRGEMPGPAALDPVLHAAALTVVPGIEVHSAPDADDYIVARCAELSGARELWIVSADRALGDRARRHGAHRVSPWAFAGNAASSRTHMTREVTG